MKHLKLFESYNNDNDILKDIYKRVDKSKFSEWLDAMGEFMEDLSKDQLYDYLNDFLQEEFGFYVRDGVIDMDLLLPEMIRLIGKNPIRLFHFTSSSFLDSIKEKGLVPGFHKTNPHGNSYSGVYLTSDVSSNTITNYKRMATSKHGGVPIRIDVKVYLDEIIPDADDADISSGDTQFIFKGIIPSDRILNSEF